MTQQQTQPLRCKKLLLREKGALSPHLPTREYPARQAPFFPGNRRETLPLAGCVRPAICGSACADGQDFLSLYIL